MVNFSLCSVNLAEAGYITIDKGVLGDIYATSCIAILTTMPAQLKSIAVSCKYSVTSDTCCVCKNIRKNSSVLDRWARNRENLGSKIFLSRRIPHMKWSVELASLVVLRTVSCNW